MTRAYIFEFSHARSARNNANFLGGSPQNRKTRLFCFEEEGEEEIGLLNRTLIE